MEAPPGTLTLALGAGEDVREVVCDLVRRLGRSEIRGPVADGGFFGEEVAATEAGMGN